MDRMSPLDASFLHLEDGTQHMHIASCAVFEGPPPEFAEMKALVASKLPLVPRYRQRVRFVPGAIGRPVWVDDPHFNVDFHVRHTALPPPGTEQDLRNLMGRLMSQALDRHRPLWENWVVEGLPGDRWALVSKIHHCMVDGISGTDLLGVVLDLSPAPTVVVPDYWRPEPEPTDEELVADALRELVRSPYEMARRLRASLRVPQRALASARETLAGAQSLAGRLSANTPLSIEGTIGPHRRWAWAEATLDDVKAVKNALGGTVNDVLLSVITAGFRDLLLERGDEVDGVVLRTLVPVSVRSGDDHTFNNQVSGMIAELPVGIEDPLERLQSIREQMNALKGSGQAASFAALQSLVSFAPPVMFDVGLRAAATVLRRSPQRSVNTVTTNVPGPQFPLYAVGRRMLRYYPFVPLSHGVRIGVAITSYDGHVAFGVTGDFDAVPDLDVLTAGIERAVAELVALAAARKAKAAAPARKAKAAAPARKAKAAAPARKAKPVAS